MRKTCEFCRNFEPQQLLSAGCADGTVFSSGCWRKVEHTYTRGGCAKMVHRDDVVKDKYADGHWDVISPLDAVTYNTYDGNGHGDGGFGAPKVGPDFGCIHWEKRP